jgi:tetraacyldisaccharide 4'-kinase
MNFNNFFLKSFRVLLLPFAIVYGFVVTIRNWLYNKNYLKSAHFNFPLICVGNLAVGGTGKSPMVEYLVRLLKPHFKTATLSRGYKRKTKGYALASKNTTALEIGDEPMQFHIKFPDVAVAVGEERIEAIPQLLHDKPNLQVIVLDDALQHRTVNAGLNILLTDYSNIYTQDFFLPTGDLRDEKRSADRAEIIVVTKCPIDITQDKKYKILRSIKPKKHQRVFFTTIEYGTPYHIYNNNDEWILTPNEEVLLVCGIANPKPLKEYLLNTVHTYFQKDYSDHHIFNIDDLNDIKQTFDKIKTNRKLILTTEKDAVRLIKFSDELKDIPLYVLPVKHKFLFDDTDVFNNRIIDFVKNFSLKLNEEKK